MTPPKLAQPMLAQSFTDRLSDVSKTLLSRADGWFNPFTGFGTSRDKTSVATFGQDAVITEGELSSLYHGDDMANKICALLPREMFRQGIEIKCPNTDAAKRVQDKFRELQVAVKFRDAAIWGRTFGGGVIFVGADDGGRAIDPLITRAIKSLTFLDVYDKRDVSIAWRYTDQKHPKFGQPEMYRLSDVYGRSREVHESRLIIFHGAHTAVREKLQLNGWDFSVLQSCYSALRQFEAATKSSELMLTDASQGVFKMHGLIAAIAGGNKDDLITRAQLLDIGRSTSRSVMLDADSGEDFTKVATSFAGVADMLSKSALRLAAAAEIPVTILMGQAPAGLNATGDSDIRIFYDKIRTSQEHEVKPQLQRIANIICQTLGIQETMAIKFPPLWQSSPKERAEERKLVADTDAIYILNEVLTPEEIALARFGPDGWTADLTIDPAERNRHLAAAAALAPPAPPAVPPPAPPAVPPPAPAAPGAPPAP